MKDSKMDLLRGSTNRIEIKPIGVSIINKDLIIMFNLSDTEKQLKIILKNVADIIFLRKVQMAKKIAIMRLEESNESCKYFYLDEKDLVPCKLEIIE